MGTNTLTPKSGSPIIDNTWYNDIVTALKLDHVPRNASGIPSDESGSIGSSDYQWLNGRFKKIFLDGDLLTPSEYTGKSHRINSGKIDSNNYPDFLSPAGAAGGLSATLQATATALDMLINSTEVTVSSDTAFSSLTAAPSTNNTCLIDDTGLTGAASSKTLGEYDNKPIVIDTIGTEISDKDGEIGAFLTGTEVFLAKIDTTNSKLWPIFRGWAGTSRSVLTDNDTITLLALNTLLIKSDGSTKVSSDYYPETCSTAPSAATAGKIYLERSTNKIAYDTGSAIDYDYMLLGFAVCNTADCLYVQHNDFESFWLSDISLDYQITAVTTISIKRNSYVSVNGKRIAFHEDFDLTVASNMDTGESIAANTLFYIYVKEDGSAVISSVAPRLFCATKKGFYHPSKYFRCVGAVFTNGSSQFALKREQRKSSELIENSMVPVGTIVAFNGGYYGDGSNGSHADVLGNTVAAVKSILPDNWKVCDGSEIYDPESPIFNGSGRYIENLTDDRFLMGDTTAGSVGGSNTMAHTHNIAHNHQWMHSESNTDYYVLNSSNDAKTSIGTGDTKFLDKKSHLQDNSGLFTAEYVDPTTLVFDGLYTTGVLSPPSGSAGSTAASGSASNAENRPSYLACIYIRKIK